MVALNEVAAPHAPEIMSKSFGIAAALVLSLVLPATASASGIIYEGAAAEWKTFGTATSTGGGGYWDRLSYDSLANTPIGACSGGTLVAGIACDWGGSPGTVLVNPRAANLPTLQYYGLSSPAAGAEDIPLNFYFSGPFDFDWAVLFQLSGWDDTVEFGWYEAGNPDARYAIAGPGGPYTSNDGNVGVTGSTSVPTGDFGFYYRNTRYGTTPDTEIIFFTQSRFNRLGAYFSYFSDLASGINFANLRTDDEALFRLAFDNARGFQQFAAFYDGHSYWLALEDQFGLTSPLFCSSALVQPCSDYDYNDFIINFTETPHDVPEPATLTLLAGAAIAVLRRRARA